MRWHPQVDVLRPHRRLHGPAANIGAWPDLAEFDHAERSFVRDERARLDECGKHEQSQPQIPDHRHGSFRT